MRSVPKVLLMLALVALIAAPVLAKDGKKKHSAKGKHGGMIAQLSKKLEALDLTKDQVEKLKQLKEKFGPELAELQAKAKPTAEQREAMKEAKQKADAAGKKGKELRQAIQAAMNLTPEQTAARKEMQEIMRTIKKEIGALLTPEQKEKAHLGHGPKRGGKKGKRGKKKNG